MIAEKLIDHIIHTSGADARTVRIAIENCKAKGVLTKQEVMQLDNQGLPISRILKTILQPTAPNGLDVILDTKKITYDDLICMIGIIAQDLELQRQSRSTQR